MKVCSHLLIALFFLVYYNRATAQEVDFEPLSFFNQSSDLSPSEKHQLALDSFKIVYGEEDYAIYDGDFIIGPGEKLIAYAYEGEFCGAYCNPLYLNFLEVPGDGQSKSKTYQFELEMEFGISSIESLPTHPGFFLVSGPFYGRPRGTESVSGTAMVLVEIIGDSLALRWDYSVTTSTFAYKEDEETDDIASLIYYPETDRVEYEVRTYEEGSEMGSNRMLESGAFQFQGNTFMKVEESLIFLD